MGSSSLPPGFILDDNNGGGNATLPDGFQLDTPNDETPALASEFGYNDSEDNGVGAWGDNTNNPDIVGVSLPRHVLRDSFGDENAAHGAFVEVTNPHNGSKIIAPIVDKGPAKWVEQRDGANAIDLTHGANSILGGNGKSPMNYKILGHSSTGLPPGFQLDGDASQQPSAAKLPPGFVLDSNGGGNAPSLPSADELPQVSDSVADQAGLQKWRDNATGMPIARALPVTELDKPKKQQVGFWQSVGRGINQSTYQTDKVIAAAPATIAYYTDKAVKGLGGSSDFYSYWKDLMDSYDAGIKANSTQANEEQGAVGQIGQGVGAMAADLPAMLATGGLGAETNAAKLATQEAPGLFTAIKDAWPSIKHGIQSMALPALKAGDEAAQAAVENGDGEFLAVSKGVASAVTTAVTGALPLSMQSKIANPVLRVVQQGAMGWLTGMPVIAAQNVVNSWISGKPYVPEELKQLAIDAVPMGLATGAFGAFHAPAKEAPVTDRGNLDAQSRAMGEQTSSEANTGDSATAQKPYDPSKAPKQDDPNEKHEWLTATEEEAPAPKQPVPEDRMDDLSDEEAEPYTNPVDEELQALTDEQNRLVIEELPKTSPGTIGARLIQDRIDEIRLRQAELSKQREIVLSEDKSPIATDLKLEQGMEESSDDKWVNKDRARDMESPASWVIKNKDTGEIVMETFSQDAVDKLNSNKYEAIPIRQHLEEINNPEKAKNKGSLFDEEEMPFNLAGEEDKTSRTPEELKQAQIEADLKAENEKAQGGLFDSEQVSNPKGKRPVALGFFGEDPVISYLIENPIRSKSVQARLDKVRGTDLASLYDDAPQKLSAPSHNKIYGGEQSIDQAHQALVDLGYIPAEASISDLWNHIARSSKQAVKIGAERKAEVTSSKAAAKEEKRLAILKQVDPAAWAKELKAKKAREKALAEREATRERERQLQRELTTANNGGSFFQSDEAQTSHGQNGVREASGALESPRRSDEAIHILNQTTPRKNNQERFAAASVRDLDELKRDSKFLLAAKLAKIFGKKIVAYRGLPGDGINGATGTNPKLGEYIFLKVDGARPHLFTLGHELWHHIELQSPKLAASLRKELLPLIKDWAGLEEKYRAANYKPHRFFDEHIADFLGDSLQDPKFLDKLAARNPKAFKDFASRVVKWLNEVLNDLKGWTMAGDFTRDIEKARNRIADTLIKYQIRDNTDLGPYDEPNPSHDFYQQDADRHEVEPGFYSQLQRTIADKMPNKASVDQLKAIIDPAKGSGVKPDEIKWSNLEGFLEGKKSVTKEEVLDYLKNEGAVKFEERTLGQAGVEQRARLEELNNQMAVGLPQKAMELGMSQIQAANLPWKLREGTVKVSDLPAGLHEDAQAFLDAAKAWEKEKDSKLPEPKYTQYTLPGGENYREVVLTTPAKPEPTKGYTISKMGQYFMVYDGRKGIGEFSSMEEAQAFLKKTLGTDDLSKQNYISSHFTDIPNYVAHMRLDERKDSTGKDGLFIEEIQSDRHQAGREKGYIDPKKAGEMKRLGKIERELSEQAISMKRHLLEKAIDVRESPEYQELQKKISNNSDEIRKLNEEGGATGIPDAPFHKDWSVQMFKRALRDAVASGKEWIGWTSGDTQAGRYDLSKQVEKMRYFPPGSKMAEKYGTVLKAYGHNGDELINKVITPDELPDVIGKEATENLLDPDAMRLDGYHQISGEELRVGGEGMKGFYDQILPKEIGKYVKKWGAKVESESLGGEYYKIFNGDGKLIETQDTLEKAQESIDKYFDADYSIQKATEGHEIWKIQITPEMRKSIEERGQNFLQEDAPQQARGEKARAFFNPEDDRMAQHLTDGQIRDPRGLPSSEYIPKKMYAYSKGQVLERRLVERMRYLEKQFKSGEVSVGDELARVVKQLKFLADESNFGGDSINPFRTAAKEGEYIDPSTKRIIRRAPTFKEKFSKTYQRMAKTLGGIPEITDYIKAKSDWIARNMYSTDEISRVVHSIKGTIKDPVRRAAITNWIEAGGSRDLLLARAGLSKDKTIKAGYDAAASLSPEEVAVAKRVTEAFRVLRNRGLKWGIDIGSVENYVPHLWESEPVRMPGTSTKRLSENFKFAKEREIQDHFTGEQLGYKPKTKDIANLLGVYMNDMNNAINSRRFVHDLSKGKDADGRPLLSPPTGGGSPTITDKGKTHLVFPDMRDENHHDFRSLDQPALKDWAFAGRTDEGSNILSKGNLEVHPEIFKDLRNVLGRSMLRDWWSERNNNPVHNGLKGIAKFFLDDAQGYAKATMFTLSPFHQIQEGVHAAAHRVNMMSGIPKIDLRDPNQMKWAQAGLMLAHDKISQALFMEGVGGGDRNLVTIIARKVPNILGGGVSKYGADRLEAYQKYLFERYIPGLKLKTAEHIQERNMKRYTKDVASGKITEEQVMRLSARQANAAYGHLNYGDMGRNPTLQHMLQIAAVAPDFFEARARFVGQAIRGLGTKAGGEQLSALAFGAATNIIIAQTINTLENGEPDWSHPFEVRIGGRYYGLRTVWEDVWKLAHDPVAFASGRISPVVGRFVQEGIFHVNYRGEQVSLGTAIKDILTGAMPIPLQSLVRSWTQTGANNPISPLEQLLSSAGIQIHRYSPITEVYPMAREWQKKNDPQSVTTARYPVSKYQQLRYALEDGNYEAARVQIRNLQKQGLNLGQIYTGFHKSINSNFTNSGHNEMLFIQSLSPSDRQIYNSAIKRRQLILQRYGAALRG